MEKSWWIWHEQGCTESKPPKQYFSYVYYDLVRQFAKQFFINTFIILLPNIIPLQ